MASRERIASMASKQRKAGGVRRKIGLKPTMTSSTSLDLNKPADIKSSVIKKNSQSAFNFDYKVDRVGSPETPMDFPSQTP
jgi:hypothetical protein